MTFNSVKAIHQQDLTKSLKNTWIFHPSVLKINVPLKFLFLRLF